MNINRDGKDIKKLRLRLRLTQRDLADLLGVDPITVSRWERQEQRPRLYHIRKLERLEKKGKGIGKAS